MNSKTSAADKCSCGNKRREVGLIIRANRLHYSALEKRLKLLGLHRSQHMLLMSVARENGNISQKALAERLQVTPAAVAMMLKKLEFSGYVLRSVDASDGRVNNIAISEKGEKIVSESREIFREVDDGMLRGISADDLNVFISVMEKINGNLIELGGMDVALPCRSDRKKG